MGNNPEFSIWCENIRICTITSIRTLAQRKSIANRIVQTHNSFDGLLEAAQTALKAFNTGDTLGGAGLYKTITGLEQAIAEAEDAE